LGLSYDISDKRDSEKSSANVLSRLTVEQGIYLLIAAVAIVMIFVGLGNSPLSPSESKQALAVWNSWQPDSDPLPLGSPVYFTFASWLTQLIGFGDATMRVIPALFAFGTVLLPWYLREWSGRIGAIITSFLLAFSPLLIVTSRTAGGDSIALFAGLLFLIAMLQYKSKGTPGWYYTSIVAMVLGLLSSVLFYGLISTLGIAWFAQVVVGPTLFDEESNPAKRLSDLDRSTVQRGIAIGLGTVLILGTGLLTNLRGIGAASNILSDWLAMFVSPSEFADLLAPFRAITRYEVILVVLGLFASIWSITQKKAYPRLMVYWLLGGLLLIIIQRGHMINALLLIIPGLIIVGRFFNDLISEPASRYRWMIAGGVVLAGAVVYVNLIRYSRIAALNPTGATFHMLLVFLSLAIVGMLLVLLGSWEKKTSIQGALIGLLVILILYSWGTSWHLSKNAANDTREVWVTSAADDDLRLLVTTLRDVSWQTTNSNKDLQILSAVDSPSLRWYLKEYPSLEFVSVLPSLPDSQALITETDRTLSFDVEYIGADFGHLRIGTTNGSVPGQTLNRWLFHQTPDVLEEVRLIFWLRSDLVGVDS
jgi:hypothetical protein